MRHRARVRHGAGDRQGLHEQPSAARVIEVHVGNEHDVHRRRLEAESPERREHERDRVIGAGVDHGDATVALDQVHGGIARLHVLGVDRGDAARVRDHGCHGGCAHVDDRMLPR
jgi:hypothetical protein